MAWSTFKVDYVWGQPTVEVSELVYFNPAINDVAGGYQPVSGVELTNEALQEAVPTLFESSTDILAALKSDPRCEWVSDGDGWPN